MNRLFTRLRNCLANLKGNHLFNRKVSHVCNLEANCEFNLQVNGHPGGSPGGRPLVGTAREGAIDVQNHQDREKELDMATRKHRDNPGSGRPWTFALFQKHGSAKAGFLLDLHIGWIAHGREPKSKRRD